MSTTTARRLEIGRVGESVPRVDGVPKVTGEFAYSSDLHAAGMLWGHTVRSPHAHARIGAIDLSAALTVPGVHAVLTHEDVPGAKRYGLEFPDQPVLAFERVRYNGEPVVLVAAEHPEQARRAAALVRVEYEPLEPIVDPERALAAEPNRVFTKEELLREVWGFRALGRTRTLESHASRLRKKLRVNGEDRYVVNVWGVGYRLLE